MNYTLFAVYPEDSANEPFVLRRMVEDKLVVMQEYHDLVCEKCGKVNERAALARGIRPEVKVQASRAMLGSFEDFYLLSEQGKQAFASIFPGEIDYFQLPASSFYVCSAKTILQPERLDPGFRFHKQQCLECGRAREVVWGRSPPRIGSKKKFTAVNLECAHGSREVWLIGDDAARELNAVLKELEVNDGR